MAELQRIKQSLAELKPELTAKFAVKSLGLFGSVVRDDFSPQSDIDVLVLFSKPVGVEFIDLAEFIESRLQ